MSTVPILYVSQDGQTRKIAQYLASTLESSGLSNEVIDLGQTTPGPDLLAKAPIIVLASAIRYGKPLPAAEAFIGNHTTLLKARPLALLSVNLTARKEGKTTPEGSVYLRKWIKRHNLSPAVAASIAGMLDYSRYGWFDKFMIRLIMTITNGPTEPTACVEFTDWKQVDDLAMQIIEVGKKSGAE